MSKNIGRVVRPDQATGNHYPAEIDRCSISDMLTTPAVCSDIQSQCNYCSKLALTTLLLLFLASCGGGSGGSGSADSSIDDESIVTATGDADPLISESDAAECGVPQLNAWVDASMRDYYLFYDQVPDVNLADFDSPESLIRALRVLPFDSFSSVSNTTTSVAFFDEGAGFGVGFFWRFDEERKARIIYVHDEAPSAKAGLRRSDIVVAVGGIPWGELSSAALAEITGTRDAPLEARWDLISGESGEAYSVNMTVAEYNINTVLATNLITHPEYSGVIGYLAFNNFIENSEEELQDAFAQFKANAITDLVLDLRYNRGGRTRIARMLAALIASPGTDDQLLIEYLYNDKYQDRNFARFFEPQANGLGLSRVIILTTGSTASSSEIVINSLKPYIEVVSIGTTTVGKPYISAGRDFCGKRISALEAEGFNASGVSVSGGIPADCYAVDDQTRDFGRASGSTEGMLRSAANYIVFGTCDAAPVLAKNVDTAAALSNSIKSDQPILSDMMQPVLAEDSSSAADQ